MAAREAKDFKVFQPALEHVLDLQERYIACFDGTGEFAHPYDVLLDDYEPGLKTEELRPLFATLQDELVPLISAAAAAGEDGRVFEGHFPAADQQALATELLARGRLRPRALAPGPGRPPVRAQHGPHRRADHDPLGGGRPRDGRLLLPARVRARALRGPDGPAPLPHDARRGDRPGRARVADRGCGRTSSGARGRSASSSCRCCASTSAMPFDALGGAGPLPQRQPGPPQPDPDRGRRDDLQPAHRAALRARARARRGPAVGRRPARRLGRGHAPPARPRDAVAAGGRAAGHPLGRRDDRLLPDVHDRQPDVRPAVERAVGRAARHRRADRRRRLRARCASGCATTSTATGASTPRASCCGGRRGRSSRSTRSWSTSKASCWTPGC